MTKESEKYEKYINIQSVTFPLYCTKFKAKFLELLNPSMKNTIHQRDFKTYKGKVLVAEDNEANQELIKIILLKFGLEFDIVDNGLEAYDLYRKNPNYDLILMDEQMPIMDGNKSVAKILNYEKNMGLTHTPVSALTANVIKGAKERGLKSGFDSFLGKPIVLKDLEKVLKRYLKEDTQKKSEKIPELDLEKLMDELKLDKDEVNTLLDMFLKKMSKILPELYSAIEQKEYKSIALLSHSVKGSSANFRIEYIQSLASKMEKNAKEQSSSYEYKDSYEKILRYINSIKLT
jgi:CheY-like chemotaxis protein